MARVFITHEFSDVRNRIRSIIEENGHEVIGESFSTNGALDKIERISEKPDIIVIHCPQPYSDVIKSIIKICQSVKLLDAPKVRINDLDASFNDSIFLRSFRAIATR